MILHFNVFVKFFKTRLIIISLIVFVYSCSSRPIYQTQQLQPLEACEMTTLQPSRSLYLEPRLTTIRLDTLEGRPRVEVVVHRLKRQKREHSKTSLLQKLASTAHWTSMHSSIRCAKPSEIQKSMRISYGVSSCSTKKLSPGRSLYSWFNLSLGELDSVWLAICLDWSCF